MCFRDLEDKIKDQPCASEGDVCISGGGENLYDMILHCVSPYFSNGRAEPILKQLAFRILQVTNNRGFTSIAIPPLSTGICGVPIDLCAKALYDGFKDFSTAVNDHSVRIIRFVIFDQETSTDFQEAWNKFEFSEPEEEEVKDVVS